MNITQERDFKGVWIPREIWLSTKLSMLEKIILTEIDSLASENGCRENNAYFAQFCQCSESKVSETITKLIKLNYIYIEFEQNKRVLKSNLGKQ